MIVALFDEQTNKCEELPVTCETKIVTLMDIFRILDGAHIPSGGQTSAQAQLEGEAGEPKEYEYEYYDDTPLESPFVNPHDPNHQNVS